MAPLIIDQMCGWWRLPAFCRAFILRRAKAAAGGCGRLRAGPQTAAKAVAAIMIQFNIAAAALCVWIDHSRHIITNVLKIIIKPIKLL